MSIINTDGWPVEAPKIYVEGTDVLDTDKMAVIDSWEEAYDDVVGFFVKCKSSSETAALVQEAIDEMENILQISKDYEAKAASDLLAGLKEGDTSKLGEALDTLGWPFGKYGMNLSGPGGPFGGSGVHQQYKKASEVTVTSICAQKAGQYAKAMYGQTMQYMASIVNATGYDPTGAETSKAYADAMGKTYQDSDNYDSATGVYTMSYSTKSFEDWVTDPIANNAVAQGKEYTWAAEDGAWAQPTKEFLDGFASGDFGWPAVPGDPRRT